MILHSIDKQFSLAENGQIAWQRDLTNPTPGVVVAEIRKGHDILAPSCTLVDNDSAFEGQDRESIRQFIQGWLQRHVALVLEPLFRLKADDIPTAEGQEICHRLVAAMGIMERSQLQDVISKLDDAMRLALRPKKLRFGPLLVYLPELNKPVAVRMRAMLISLWQEIELPAVAPQDGIVSFSIEGKNLDKEYYRSIGYPIYGPRAMRVDMLDRVICAVYDSAKEGKFTAQHQMAEWLGSNISDLYAILEAMGHKKIHDPAETKEEVTINQEIPVAKEHTAASELLATAEESIQAKQLPIKPVLATFALKKGKATDAQRPQSQNPKNSFANKKEYSADKKKFKASSPSKGNKQKPVKERVYSYQAEANVQDSPFAILSQLKSMNKE